MTRHTSRVARPPYTTDLGTITATGLELDRYGAEVPNGDFLVDESFEDAVTRNRAGGAGEDSFAAHNHVIRAALAPGDRVYVLIVDGEEDEWTPIVTGRLAG